RRALRAWQNPTARDSIPQTAWDRCDIRRNRAATSRDARLQRKSPGFAPAVSQTARSPPPRVRCQLKPAMFDAFVSSRAQILIDDEASRDEVSHTLRRCMSVDKQRRARG